MADKRNFEAAATLASFEDPKLRMETGTGENTLLLMR